MSQASFHTVVFTDLDGTLLDDSYDLAGAAYMLNELSHRGVLTVPASSKTKAELDAFSDALTFETPLISENGAGIVWPQSLQSVLAAMSPGPGCMSYRAICRILNELRAAHDFQFVGFADMTLDEVCSATGLDAAAAARAQQRIASEPISWADSPHRLADLKAQLQARGLALVQGGRFFHVMSPVDKGLAAERILKVFCACWGRRPRVLACGDSPNDLPMLLHADRCVLFPQRDGTYLALDDQPHLRAQHAGTLTWLERVNELLNSSVNDPNPQPNIQKAES